MYHICLRMLLSSQKKEGIKSRTQTGLSKVQKSVSVRRDEGAF